MRRHDDNSDYMSRKMDKELLRLEERLTALYANATNEVTAKFADYMATFEPEQAKMLEQLAEGKIKKVDYDSWVRNRILTNALYSATVKSLTNTLVNTDEAAMAIVRGNLPYVIAQSYNFVQGLGWKAADDAGYSVGTFEIYNASSVQKLIKDNPELLPHVDIPEDQKWNQDRINREITQGIIQGDSMPAVAKRLQRVANMDENAAMRTARTSMTYAENLGRDESYNRLKEKGLPVNKKWSAVLDERTRETHRQLNGTYANAQGLFGEGILATLIRCPADPQGDAQEIYNCRCRLGVVFDKPIVDHSNDKELYKQFLKENAPDSYEQLEKKDYFNQHDSTPKKSTEQAKKEPAKPTYRTASNAKEAVELLKEMGFGKISSGVKNIDEKLFVDNVNALSRLNSRFKAITPNMEFSTGKMNSVAYVRRRSDRAGSVQLKLSTDFYNNNPNRLLFTARGATDEWKQGIPAFWMPVSEEFLTTCSLTHEYGHVLQNLLLNTQEVVDTFLDYRKRGDYWNANRTYTNALAQGARKHREEIVAIAKEINPDYVTSEFLSRYGRKNDAEFFAECFMNAFCGAPNVLGQAMLTWLERQGL